MFNVTLVNDGTMAHSIDFHACQVAPNVAMRRHPAGQSLVYQFKADYAGIWMYHCGTAPAIEHIANGMFGAVIIDPPNLAPVAHEYVMIQSELYLGPQGQPGDLAKMLADTPDAVVFNGYVNQYKFAPIKVDPGQRIRIWVLDAGPNDISSFHIVGTIFDTVFKEGHYELQPGNPTGGGSQALDLDRPRRVRRDHLRPARRVHHGDPQVRRRQPGRPRHLRRRRRHRHDEPLTMARRTALPTRPGPGRAKGPGARRARPPTGVGRGARAAAPVGVAELAGALEVHPNTVRLHLARLVDAGLVTEHVEADRHPGRPGYRYRAAAPTP